MKKLEINSFQIAGLPVCVAMPLTAHSGPELIGSMANANAAMDLASILLSANTKVESEPAFRGAASSSGMAGHISLSRR